jgi:hypothetical protein
MSDQLDVHNELTPQDKVVELVKVAKRRPLPKSTKGLFVILVFGLVFTGGIVYGKHNATASTGTGLSLGTLGGGGFGGAGGFGGNPFRNNGGSGTGSTAGALTSGGTGNGAAATPTDVAGTVISVTSKSIVVTDLSGAKQTFPITETTKVRASTVLDLSKVKTGDIVTIKPDDANAAKTIMVVK